MSREKCLRISGTPWYSGTLSLQSNANRSWAGWKEFYALPMPCLDWTELYLKELRPTLCFGHILCAVSFIIAKTGQKLARKNYCKIMVKSIFLNLRIKIASRLLNIKA